MWAVLKKILANDYVLAILLLLIIPACFCFGFDFCFTTGIVIADGPDPDHPGHMIGFVPNLWRISAEILVIAGLISSLRIRKKIRREMVRP